MKKMKDSKAHEMRESPKTERKEQAMMKKGMPYKMAESKAHGKKMK